MRTVTVYFSDGDTITTDINGTDDTIANYYLGRPFELSEDRSATALLVHFLDTDRRWGLVGRNIENDATGQIADVQNEIVKVDENESFEQIVVKFKSGNQYALDDLWIYAPDGTWLPHVGCPQAVVRR
jgi:hypothetical protein